LLNDDDDEIRDAAALVTSRLLRNQGFRPHLKDAIPIISVQRLGAFMATSFAGSSHLYREALRRLVGASVSQDKLIVKKFTITLAEERKEDTALFSQEKQNLYKDDVMDVVFWSIILRSTPIRQTYISDLEAWVLDGLSALTETAATEVDGPLGWTNKAEVFTLGFRVLCGADVVLNWGGHDASKIMLALSELRDVGKGGELNGLWLEKIDRILEDVVVRALARVYRALSAVQI
jgi:hypothetical protein